MESLKLRYLVFISSVILTIVASQLVIQYDLNEQNSDARLINLAGRQRMLSQRISKLTLFLQYNKINNKDTSFYRLDTLSKLINDWEEVHFQLIKQNELSSKSLEIDSLLKNNTDNLRQVVSSCRQILKSPDSSTVKRAIDNIAKFELPFLLRMERTVQTYQKEAEQKLKFLKQLELVLSALAVVILISEFTFIVIPGSNQLKSINEELTQRNSELVASEEEIRSSLEQIRALQIDLEVRQTQYEGLIDWALDSIYELDHRGNLSFVNPLMEKMTGFTKLELLGKNYSELLYPEDTNLVITFYQDQVRNKQEVSYLEFRIQTKGGHITWVGQNVRLFFDQEKVYKVSVVARDINQIKESQFALSLERILLRTIIDNIPVHIYAKNLKSEKILANRTEFEYLGAKNETDVLGKSDRDLYPPEIAEISIEEDIQVFRGEVILNKETLSRRKDGSETWFLSSKLPLRNDSKQIIALVGISIDITEQKKAKEELERSEKLYRLLADNSQDVISLHQLDGTFEYVSPSSINLHGYYPHELVGRNGIEFILVDDVQKILSDAPSQLERMKNNQTLEPSQFRIVTKNRGIVWVENLIKPLFENGELSGFQSTVRDISTRKAYEIALEKAKQAAEQATSAKSQFLSMMSHEIRTPMNGIVGITNLLLSENPRPDQTENLGLLKFSCNNLLSIINDILDYSKVEAGKIELEKISFNLADTIQRCKSLHEYSAREKGIELSLQVDERIPNYLLGDPVRISQVLNNLLSNALKFTDSGAVKMRATYEGRHSDLHRINFSIEDTGIGIAEDKIESVFEGFNQASSDITRKFGGTGLGLAISKRFLELMNSRIHVKSILNKGSEFSFTLNLPKGREILSTDTENSVPLSNQSIEVLLVEDNRVNQLVAKRTLENWGVLVTIAENGFEAIEKLELNKFHLVLMDIHMPGMTGYDATKIIRSKVGDYYKSLRIVALTADVSQEIKQKAMDSGMDDVIGKPFVPSDLRAIIQKYTSEVSNNPRETASISLAFPKLRLFSGGDLKFESELKVLLINSLRELSGVVTSVLTDKSTPEDLDSILHKSRTALNLVDDVTINELLRKIKVEVVKSPSEENRTQVLVSSFELSISRIIDKLNMVP